MRNQMCIQGWVVLFVSSMAAHGATEQQLLSEDFESGLDAWTVKSTLGPNDDAPMVFEADGTGPNGALAYGLTTFTWTSRSAGYSSDLDPWDGSSPQWIEKEFHVPAGTYDIQLDFDRYVYYGGESTDFWALGNRVYLLTDADFALDPSQWDQINGHCPGFDCNATPPTLSTSSFRRTLWVGQSNGEWEHMTVSQPATPTTTGNFVLRLLMHEKYSGRQTVLWDNIVLHLQQGGQDVAGFPFSEDFEGGLGANGWVSRSPVLLVSNDTPTRFPPEGTGINGLNTPYDGQEVTWSAGFSSNLAVIDTTRAEWLVWQRPAAVDPGTYDFRLEFDRYVYQASTTDPNGLGNRVFLLTDNEYNNPAWNFDGTVPENDLRLDFWSGDAAWALNGVWHHEVIETSLTTTTGNLEVRLMQHEKAPGAQTVAWDNVKLSVILPCNQARFDADGDGDVDQADFAVFQECYSGDGVAIASTGICQCMNADGTQNGIADVDQIDLQVFEGCASGPGVPASTDGPCGQ